MSRGEGIIFLAVEVAKIGFISDSNVNRKIKSLNKIIYAFRGRICNLPEQPYLQKRGEN